MATTRPVMPSFCGTHDMGPPIDADHLPLASRRWHRQHRVLVRTLIVVLMTCKQTMFWDL
jgi:hypothetical protein